MSKSKENIILSAIYNLIGFFVNDGLRYFYEIIISRVLKKELYGIFNFAMNIAAYVPWVSDLGLFRAADYYITKTEGDKRVISTSFYLKIFLQIVFSIGILLISYIFLNEYWIYILLALIYFFFIDNFFFLNNIYSCLKNFKKANIIETCFTFTKVVFAVVAVIFTHSLFGLFYALILSSAIFFFYLVYNFRKSLDPKYFDRSKIKDLFNFGKYSGLVDFSNMLFDLVDTTILGVFLSTVYVGFYNIAYMIYISVIRLLDSVISTFFPYVISWIEKGEIDKIKKLHNTFVDYILFIAIPLAILLFFKAELIILTLFGEEYIGVVIILQIFALLVMKEPFDLLYSDLVTARGDIKYIAKVTGFVTILNIPLDILSVYTFGYVGVVISTLILEYFRIYLLYRYVKKTFGFTIDWKSLTKPVISGLIFLIFILAANRFPSPMDIVIPCILYLIYFHLFVKNIFDIVNTIKNKIKNRGASN